MLKMVFLESFVKVYHIIPFAMVLIMDYIM